MPLAGVRAPILLPMREVQRELMRLLGLIAGGFDVLDMGGFCVPIGLPMREVLLELGGVGWLNKLLDGLRVKSELLVCGEVVRLGVVMLGELLDGILLGWEMLGLVVLLNPVKPEGMEVLGLAGDLRVLELVEGLKVLDLVGDRSVLDLVGGLKVLDLVKDLLDGAGLATLAEGLLTVGAGEDLELEDDWLLRLLLLDLELLLRMLPNDTGSARQRRARARVRKAIFGMSRYLGVHILLLLSSALVLGRIGPITGKDSRNLVSSTH